MVQFHTVSKPSDMERVVDLEIAIWGIGDRDAFAPHLLSLVPLNGGVVIVAEDAGEFVAFCAASPALRDGDLMLWSYMAGVHPSYQGRGIGYELKQFQREWAAKQGFNTLHWTFDPLKARNANFNLNLLGATGYRYHSNLYGRMVDEINVHPLPSDRIEVFWDTATDTPSDELLVSDAVPMLVDRSAVEVNELTPDALPPYVGICSPPSDADNLDVWQEKMRRAFLHAFALGYTAQRYIQDTAWGYYLLKRND